MICALCGLGLSDSATQDICEWHPKASNDNWAQANKIWCDLFHRGVPIERLDTFEDDNPCYNPADPTTAYYDC